jgi:hypothetical protein
MYDNRRWVDTIPGIYSACYQHEKYLHNIAPIVRVGMVFSEQTDRNYGPGMIDIAVWKQKESMTVHLVNLTNPMMMKGPYRELIPSPAQEVRFNVPVGSKVKSVRLLISGGDANEKVEGETISLKIPQILDHEIIAVDLA